MHGISHLVSMPGASDLCRAVGISVEANIDIHAITEIRDSRYRSFQGGWPARGACVRDLK
jgi:hypothetical protein